MIWLMAHSYRHQGGPLPITLTLDQTDVDVPCPTCARAEYEGTISFKVDGERPNGMTPAQCDRGHLVMVNWSRSEQ